MRLFKLIRLAFYGLFTITVIAGYYVYINTLKQPLNNREHTLVIPNGVGVSWLANHLEENQIIDNKYLFRLYTLFKQKQLSIKAGEYTLVDINSVPELLQKVHQGKVVQYAVTLIEGKTFKQYLKSLAQQSNLKNELNGLSDTQIMELAGAPDRHPEGQFAPETYLYQKGDSNLDVLKQAHQRLKIQLEQAWQDRAENSQVKTSYELLILASIIEKETGADYERPIIAGVFTNRLKKGMKLQTDPTVIYGMGDNFRGNIRRRDLTTDTAYNTYTRYGLPPTPIAMAGRASILAAANPQKNKFLYFVGKGDGSHYFSKTLKEHNNAVIKYQLKGKAKRFTSN